MPRAPYVRGDEATRFWPKVNKTETCWIWTAALNGTGPHAGYGIFRRSNATNVRAHVWAWEQENGPVPEGLELDHLECSNRACVRPSHLQAVTHLVNCQRSQIGRRAWRRERETCKHGHVFDENTTRWITDQRSGNLVRVCKVCAAAAAARRYEKVKRRAVS